MTCHLQTHQHARRGAALCARRGHRCHRGLHRLSSALPRPTRSFASARRDLTLCRLTPDLIYDQMIAAGVARKLVFSYLGNPGVGSLHCIRRAIEKGIPHPLEIEEYSAISAWSAVIWPEPASYPSSRCAATPAATWPRCQPRHSLCRQSLWRRADRRCAAA